MIFKGSIIIFLLMSFNSNMVRCQNIVDETVIYTDSYININIDSIQNSIKGEWRLEGDSIDERIIIKDSSLCRIIGNQIFEYDYKINFVQAEGVSEENSIVISLFLKGRNYEKNYKLAANEHFIYSMEYLDNNKMILCNFYFKAVGVVKKINYVKVSIVK